MSWLLRLAILVLILYLLRAAWRWFWAAGWKRLFNYTVEKMDRPPAPTAYVGTMKRDPMCGTHVDVSVAVQNEIQGEIFYFCSEGCRDAYRARRQQEPVHKTG